jgi:CTP:molybdopterin cytidylyltransferase MocA
MLLVLAAGEGRRMGAPKALLELAGEPLIRLHVQRALGFGCARALVIVRPALTTRIETLFAHPPYRERVQVISARTSSQASSLAVLVRALAHADGLNRDLTLLVTPVDTLPCSVATYRALDAAMDDHTLAATPRFAARGGHPVMLRASLLEPYLHGPLDGCPPLRDLLADAGAQRTRVDVTDPCVVADADTPADARVLGLRLPPSAAL